MDVFRHFVKDRLGEHGDQIVRQQQGCMELWLGVGGELWLRVCGQDLQANPCFGGCLPDQGSSR